MNFKDVCDGEAPDLNILTLRATATLCSYLDFSEGSISFDIIQTIINSITSQAITPYE